MPPGSAEPASPADIAQWCFPCLRQHAGRFASAALAAKSGQISGSSNSNNKQLEITRRTSDPNEQGTGRNSKNADGNQRISQDMRGDTGAETSVTSAKEGRADIAIDVLLSVHWLLPALYRKHEQQPR